MNKRFLHVLLIILLGFLVYSNTFNVPFHLDDRTNIIENREIKDLIVYLQQLFTEDIISNLRYIGYLTFSINYKLHGIDVTGYHLVNLLIHIINAVLVYVLVILTFTTPVRREITIESDRPPFNKQRLGGNVALFSALLFLSHPLQTQAVTYIVQRFASLATMFYLLSLIMYIKMRVLQIKESESRFFPVSGIIFYSISIVSAVFAMKTKQIAFTLPLTVAVYEFIFLEGKIRKRILYLMPLLLTMLIIPLSLLSSNGPVEDLISDVSEVTKVQTEMSRIDYLLTQFRVVMTYVRLIFFPVNQNLLYDYPVYRSFFNVNVIFSFLFLLLLFSCAVYLIYRIKMNSSPRLNTNVSESLFYIQGLLLMSFGIFWFFITLSVESSIIPIKDVIFEHRMYLPSAGIFISIATFVFLAADKFRTSLPGFEKTVKAALICVIIAFCGASYARNIIWQDEITLWEDVVKKSPGHPAGLTNLGEAYAKKGQLKKAIVYFHRAIAISPDMIEAYSNLGVAYSQQGQPDKAIFYFNKMATLKPDYFKSHYNLGIAYGQKGLLDKAIHHFEKAVALDPYHAKVFNHLGLAYYLKGQHDNAIIQYKKAVELQPDYADAHYNLGVAYSGKGLRKKAGKHFQKAKILKR
jgi:tetratricopeptide (TPR) repeat protein